VLLLRVQPRHHARPLARSGVTSRRCYREIDLAASLFDPDREVVQLHFGGGTPNFLSPAQLREVVDTLRRRFHFTNADGLDCSIELDPRALTPSDVAELASMGSTAPAWASRISTRWCKARVNRVQSVGETVAIVEACRRHGIGSVNIDLIYGLPHQTPGGFSKTLETVLAMRPDRLAVYGYAHLPKLVKAQTRIDAATLPTHDVKLGLLQLAIETLTAAGYVHIGMDHFALPDDELALAQGRAACIATSWATRRTPTAISSASA
jgi:oxygen-independent coproporphyrinogen-3 oxidase